ncbi:hypothetical protein H7J93_23745 [Mycobacterium barrassiae]|uniref:DUF7155 family protein n=1 Tax=Mycobacterium barrassiae TaxID=319709 RepID=UPI002265CE7D|nr:hypothetical protein [Mycobacterium barrassiae]MCV7302641.1 hypothetical protein [Mycobacterium barrassiae]
MTTTRNRATKNRARKLIAAGAFAVAAVAAPFAASALTTTDSSDAVALPPGCLAWYGNQETGKCLGYSQGNGVNLGTPAVGAFGENGGIGVNTGPLFPGTTINRGIG